MTACNDCWDEAFRRAQIGGGHQVEHYEAILLLPSTERPWCAFAQSQTRGQQVEPVGDEWVGTCDHGTEVWAIHRTSEYAARRSLTAHASQCTRPTPSTWCLCGFVDDRGDGTCGNCDLPIMTDEDEMEGLIP